MLAVAVRVQVQGMYACIWNIANVNVPIHKKCVIAGDTLDVVMCIMYTRDCACTRMSSFMYV